MLAFIFYQNFQMNTGNGYAALFFAKAIFSEHHSMMVSEFPKEKGTQGVQNGIHELEVTSLKKYI